VLKLKKALYGLKQAPRAWNSRINKYFLDNGNNPNLCEDFKEIMSCEFEIIDIGLLSYYLGLEVKQMNNDIFVSQESYTKKVLERFKIFDCNPLNTPVEGSLKLSKFGYRGKGRSYFVQKSCRKLKSPLVFFNMYVDQNFLILIEQVRDLQHKHFIRMEGKQNVLQQTHGSSQILSTGILIALRLTTFGFLPGTWIQET
ncbi:Copia protein, partial [Mucuna pruriens]